MPWAVKQPGYEVETVATGLQLPVSVALVPDPGSDPGDPFLYVTELYGTIKVVTRDGTVSDYATGLLNFNPTGNFPGSGEQGVTGITVDPASGDVFASMVYQSGASGQPHYPKVVRFHSDDGGKTAATRTTILDMFGEVQGASHQVSNLTIGPDGRLYVHNGDGFDSTTAQNLNSFRGKVLRMNLYGSAASNNRFYDASDGITARDYVFAYGFRNPFGGAWRAADSGHYAVENGPSVDRLARVVAGQNYGWDGTNASMGNFALYNWDPAHAPVNIAFVQPQTFAGSGFPFEKRDHAFVTESGPTWATGPQARGKRIVEFAPGADDSFAGSKPVNLVEYTGTGKATAAGLAAGPDGLYFTELYKDQDYTSAIDAGARLLRVSWVGDLTPPAVTVTTPAHGSATNDPTVTLTGAAGIDRRDSHTVTVKIWSGDSPSGSPLHTADAVRTGNTWSVDAPALAEGTYTARAEQSDSAGNTGLSIPHTFTVDTTRPGVSLTTPIDGSVTNDPTVTLTGAAGIDRRDSHTVTVKIWSGDSPSGSPLHTADAVRTGNTWFVDAPALAEGTYTARAEQSDSAGNTGVSTANTFRVSASAVPSPFTPIVDVKPPAIRLGGKRIQKAGKRVSVVVKATSENVRATASGKVSIRGKKKAHKLKGVKARFIARGHRATLRLKVSKKALRAIKRALGRHRKVWARLTIKARDAAGNTTIKRRTIKLRR
jgi:glucose/arabinose dehydrogenase